MKEVYQFLDNLIKINDSIVVAVSTGPDSMALLNILMEYRVKKALKLIVAHVNHNVRKESNQEYTFLEDFCHKNSLIFEGMIIEKYGDDNFHNEARNIRYHFYEKIINKYSAKYLFTGHHGDDLIETILMRMVRGSSIQGYSGFKQIVNKKNYQIIRPLVYVTKKELEDYDVVNKVPFYIDNSNYKDLYTRNRYRKYVLPELKKEDQNVHLKFLKFSKELQEYDDFVNKMVNVLMKDVYLDGLINIKLFCEQELFLQKHMIKRLLANIYHDDLMEIDDRHVNLILKIITSSRSSCACNLPNDYLFVKEYNKGYFKKEIDTIIDYDIELNDVVVLENGMKIIKEIQEDRDGNDVMRLSSKDVVLPLRVRTRKYGDRMTIKNMDGSKKVSDILVNSKIPKSQRDSYPIVVDSNDNILWIPKIKKSKYNRRKDETCDIIYKCL